MHNSIPLTIVAGGQQEVIRLEVIINAGRWTESVAGSSYFTAQQLSKGTSNKSSFEIARLFDYYGAHFESSAGVDVTTLTVYALTRNLGPVVALLVEILQTPVFPEKEFEQAKAIYLQNLKVNKEKTSFLASTLFRKKLFGMDHPYGREVLEDQVTSLTTGHLNEFYRTNYQDCQVVVSGKVNAQAEEQIASAFSTLVTQHNLPASHTVTQDAHDIEHITKADSVQSSLRVGKRSIGRAHADYPEFILVNHILGGYFGSRLMKNIREEKGLTYGISSSLHAMQHDSYLVIGTDVNKENRDLTFSEITREMKLLQTERVPDSELDTARYHFMGSLQSDLSTPFAHADKWKNILLFDLPEQYYTSLLERLQSATADQLIEVARKHYDTESFLKVSAG